MKTSMLDYQLPAGLIAQKPSDKRSLSRLLVLDRIRNTLADRQFGDLLGYLKAGDCLVLNDTKVLPARFYIQKESGVKLEALLVDQPQPGVWQVLVKNARRLKAGQAIALLDKAGHPAYRLMPLEKTPHGFWVFKIDSPTPVETILEQVGFAPLPPYIKRDDPAILNDEDLRTYQTVYAKTYGAIAAPTAGLHFDKPLLDKLEQMGVQTACVTLHVGIGTFKPIQTETLDEHPMHYENYEITLQAAEVINQTKAAGGRVVAVGTTSVRTLESACSGGIVKAKADKTNLFITPGYHFQMVDAMITNFHLPRSTLLALVGAFAGLDTILKAYHHAVEQEYRFFSYGDAMLIL